CHHPLTLPSPPFDGGEGRVRGRLVESQPMANASVNCPSCGGAMSVPPGMEGMTVACAHCKRPFQVPDLAPSVFAQQIPEGPRRRSVGRPPGSNPWIWLAIGLPCIGILLALLFLWKGSDKDLKQGQLLQMYEAIEKG